MEAAGENRDRSPGPSGQNQEDVIRSGLLLPDRVDAKRCTPLIGAIRAFWMALTNRGGCGFMAVETSLLNSESSVSGGVTDVSKKYDDRTK